MGIPAELVQRSAAARAAETGATVDDVLAAWSGGAPAPSAAPAPAEPEATAPAETEAQPETEQAPEPVAVAVAEPPVEAAVEPEAEPEVVLEPVPMATRVKTAVRIGAWTGAALGVIGFLAASAFWAPNAIALPESGPVVQLNPTSLIIGIALVSVVFGAVVAGVSRAATGWSNPAMELSGSKAVTVWVGAIIGLVLGVVAGATLSGFGTAVEGADPPIVELPVLTSLFVMVIGGAVLGALTAMVPQLLGVPVAVADTETEEVVTVKRRLAGAVGVPLAGLVLLLLLVLPFAYTLIESNHLAPGVGGAVVAIITAGGILGFAALAGSKPQMRISGGDVMVAVVGIGVVILLIVSVLVYQGGDEHHEEPAEGTSIVRVV